MRKMMVAAAAMAALGAPVASVEAATIPIELSADQLIQGPGPDSWTWTLTLPSVFPANGTIVMDVDFKGGVLRLGDGGGVPDSAQLQYRNALIARRAQQQAALTAAEADVIEIGKDITGKQAVRLAFTKEVQQNQTAIGVIGSEILEIQKTIGTLETGIDSLDTAIAAAEVELAKATQAVLDFIDKFGEVVGGILDGLRQDVTDATNTLSGLTAQKTQTVAQVTQQTAALTAKQNARSQLINDNAGLQSQIGTVNQEIAGLEAQKSAAEALASRLPAFLSVTDQELAQLPEDQRAEGLLIEMTGPTGEPVPLFGQLLLDIAAGDPANAAPFFQGLFEDGGRFSRLPT